MAHINYISKSNIFFSCTEKEHRGNENTVAEHALVHIYSGSMTVTDINGTYTLQEGETFLFYRNMLAKFIKQPSGISDFKSISVIFSQPFLQKFYSLNEPDENTKPKWEARQIKKHPLLISLFDSILPYYDIHGDNLPTHLTDIKLQEAITILRTVDTNVDSILANFSGQGKIDLAGFMQKSFSFNIPLERFAYLTGRSLATFKRDFRKTFNASPQKWLLETRLKQAHYLISEKNKKPSDVYLEVGFENLSHFSRSFKQHFGYTPSTVQNSPRIHK
ncbi:MAG: AraC family transcriptional regulator [Breznakibacter sp.]